MIRALLIAILILNLSPVFADSAIKPVNNKSTERQVVETYKIKGQVQYDDNPVETIYLDEDIEKPKVNIPKRTLTLPVGILDITSNADTPRSALARSMVNRSILNDILPFSGSVAEQMAGFSYGQRWEQELSYSQMESTTSFFLRYDAPRWLSLEAAARQTSSFGIDGSRYGTMRLTPELHITKHLTLKDSFTNYIDLPKNKNELKLVYTPSLKKYAEALKFELGIAQSYYQNGTQSSSVNFSTGFKL